MPDEQDLAVDPTVTDQEGWRVEDGGMLRESTEDVARTLAGEDPTGDAPAAPAEPVQDQPPAVTTAPADEDGNVEADASRRDDAAPAPKTPEPAKGGRRTLSSRAAELQRQVDTLTARKYQLQREIDAETRRRPTPKADAPAPTERTEAAPAAAPRAQDGPVASGVKKPTWSEFEAEGKTWDDFVAAQESYLEQRIEAAAEGKVKTLLESELRSLRETTERQAYEARVDAEAKARMRVVRDAHADEWPQILKNLEDVEASPIIEDVVRMHPAGADVFYELGKDPDAARVLNSFEWTNTMFDAIMASKNPSAMLLHLADDNGEFERIRQMPPAAALYALGALSATLAQSAQARDNGSRPKGVPVSKAPAPIRPVGSVSAAPSGTDDSDDDGDYLAWVRKENQRDAEKERSGRRA